MNFHESFSALKLAAEDMLWPPRCLACKDSMAATRQAGTNFCQACWAEMPWIEQNYCLRCGVSLGEHDSAAGQQICRVCKTRRWQFVWARSLLRHEGLAKQLLQRWKLEGEEFLGLSLAKLFEELDEPRLTLLQESQAIVVPIPMDPLRRLWRGYDTAEELARVFARLSGLEAKALLKRGEYRQRQLHRNGGARRKNWKGVFVVREQQWRRDLLAKRPVILIDDVMTTGSTLNAAARVLREAGCPLVAALTLTRET